MSASGAAGGPDHPRACGVYAGAPDCVLPPQGSSPRVRGLPERLSVVVLLPRIIPARAGFTRGSRSTLACPADHPRACGVYAWDAKVPGDILGSSPRVRGLPLRRSGRRFAVSDHPRACGVYRQRQMPVMHFQGSSPRVRGLPATIMSGRPIAGIIPARAGFTSPLPALTVRTQGSSPRVRGLLGDGGRTHVSVRIIPARAGFTHHFGLEGL